MNASQLYKDELYAYYDEPPKGRTPLGAAKVRLRGTESRKSSWETNRRTYALVTVVEPGNSDYTDYRYGIGHLRLKSGQELTVPARHLVDFWSDYEAETNLLIKEQQEIRDKRRRHELREQILTSVINWRLQNDKGVHLAVAILDLYDDGSGFVKFALADMIQLLEIDMQAIDERVEEAME